MLKDNFIILQKIILQSFCLSESYIEIFIEKVALNFFIENVI